MPVTQSDIPPAFAAPESTNTRRYQAVPLSLVGWCSWLLATKYWIHPQYIILIVAPGFDPNRIELARNWLHYF